MAKVGSNVVNIKVTTASSTGAYHDIRDYVRTISGLNVQALTQESEAFGDSWKEHLYTGMNGVDDITLGGYYDDVAASGPHAIFGAIAVLGAERVIKLNLGTTNEYPKVDVIVAQYNRTPTVGELTGFELVLRPTGALTYATT